MTVDWLAFLSFALVTTFTPGPNNIAAASNGVLVGYRRSLPFIVGVASGFAVVMLLCATAASLLLQWIPTAAPALRFVGAAYVLWLAWRTLRAGYEFQAENQKVLGYWNGVVLQFLNLKMILYGLAVFSTFLAPLAGRLGWLSASAVGMAGIAFSSTTTWATAGSLVGRHLHRPRLRLAVNGSLALLLVWTAYTLLQVDFTAESSEALSPRFSRALAAEAAQDAGDDAASTPPSPYVWPKGPPADPNYFPIGVWLQSPSNAAAYQALGINHFIGLWQGPTEEQLDALGVAGMPVMASQNATGLARRDNSTLMGWTQQDEPDNAQSDGQGGYGPCVAPEEIIRRYERMKAADPDRPVWLNLGQGVAWDEDRPYVGRGSECARRWDHYPEYLKGADIVSFDIYPVTSRYEHIQGDLTRVALGLDRLREWGGPDKIVWNVVETTHINSQVMPTPQQVRAEVWLSLIHGSMGIVYFAHEWVPRFREPALLDYPEIRAAVRRVNGEIADLAPVLNGETLAYGDELGVDGGDVGSEDPPPVSATTSDSSVRVDVMVKRHDGWLYIFAVVPGDKPTSVSFRPDPSLLAEGADGDLEVEVIGEARTLPLTDGFFTDRFDGYGVHLYRVRGRQEMGEEPRPPIFLPWGLR